MPGLLEPVVVFVDLTNYQRSDMLPYFHHHCVFLFLSGKWQLASSWYSNTECRPRFLSFACSSPPICARNWSYPNSHCDLLAGWHLEHGPRLPSRISSDCSARVLHIRTRRAPYVPLQMNIGYVYTTKGRGNQGFPSAKPYLASMEDCHYRSSK